jgi:hypothetical protein
MYRYYLDSSGGLGNLRISCFVLFAGHGEVHDTLLVGRVAVLGDDTGLNFYTQASGNT